MKMEMVACWNQIVSAGGEETIRLFRPPFGVTNPTLSIALKNSGYTVIGWSIRSLDTVIKNPVSVVRRVKKRIKPGRIYLFHDTQPHTPEIVERLIIFELKKIYSFVRVDDYV
jgi:peptidoglycan/xylan/chitin deacetylase (PgdA/CDA1 family)